MPQPKPARIRRTLTALTAADLTAAALLLASATDTRAATTTPVYKGTGWKAETGSGIFSLSPDPYTIVFADTTARTKLTSYLTAPAAQVTGSVGVPVTVSTSLDTTPTSACPARHRIVVHYLYRPMNVSGMSQALPCHNTGDGSAWGGHILMDSEYWTSSTWFSTNVTTNEARRKDAVTHELGHILGLDHPNTDLDKDGVVENGECVKSTAGRKPILCSPNRGVPAATDGGRFTTEYDLPGLRQMLANYYLRQTT
ncbi:hypothetical protein D0Z67_29320 (plasmid) [Streptomyces seoulensis]|uniref:Matrixin family metalloprotease n=1 Tax=Streptomyces seoulensis TaxID=73044 RepID=A0A4P6U583_STRSO|nr:M12 family metallo-peptidase [Streptomyces seoulensis]QBJ94472.1 hypothetical protein D0Z67_29320 [Streptomyces seoulensis]